MIFFTFPRELLPNFFDMILRIPDFYDKFSCIADKCTDTCCIGWEIDIDKSSKERYRNIQGDFGTKLRENIEEGHFKLLPGDRCPFLRKDGLCEMICKIGEENLCDICREHPRFVEVYGDIMEKGLGLCCEEAARLLLEAPTNGDESSAIRLVEREIDDSPDEIPEEAIEARDAIFAEREYIFNTLSKKNIPLYSRLITILDFADKIQGEAEGGPAEPEGSPDIATIQKAWIAILGEGESFGPAWTEAFGRLEKSDWEQTCAPWEFSEQDGERIVAYLIYRYYAKSLFDGDGLGKVQFAIYFWIILKKFGHILADSKINAIKLLSKQTEYSDEIMGILAENFINNPAFSVFSIKKILSE